MASKINNVFTYLDWRGDLTFAKSEFNEVDALILTIFSYLNFQCAAGRNKITFDSAVDALGKMDEEERFFGLDIMGPSAIELAYRACQTKRFHDMKLSDYVDIFDDEREIQFSAVTFWLSDGTAFLSFRGTDNTLVGWKEDLNMSFMDAVPSQLEAERYTRHILNNPYEEYQEIIDQTGEGGHEKPDPEREAAAEQDKNSPDKEEVAEGEKTSPETAREAGRKSTVLTTVRPAGRKIFYIRLGGHSKGGNLAVWAGAHLDEAGKKRILKIYNNDGPGFSEEFLAGSDYLQIKDRVKTLIPESSIVGVLLAQGSYITIKSSNATPLAHDPFSWYVMANHLVYDDDRSMSGEVIEKFLNQWIRSMTFREREDFVDNLFKVFESSDIRTLDDLDDHKLEALFRVQKSFGSLEDQNRKHIMDGLRKLFFRKKQED